MSLVLSPLSAQTQAQLSLQVEAQMPQSWAFFDSRVPFLPTLLGGLSAHTQAVVLDPNQDGIEQIAESLHGKSKISALHIISHGAPGCLYLGNSQLSEATLDKYSRTLQQWQKSLSPNADVFLYGCEVGANRAFITQLSQRLEANIAASATKTGHPSLGGNWQLEVRVGEISTPIVFNENTQKNYPGIMADFTVNILTDEADGDAATGTGLSLRDAILAANSNADTTNTITLGAGTYTLTLDGSGEDAGVSGDLDILSGGVFGKTLTIIGAGSATTIIDASGLVSGDRVFHILSGVTVNIAGVTIQGGNVSGDGGGIFNYDSTLTVTDSIITGNTATGDGGGIYSNYGTVTVIDSEITSNTSGNFGGAINNFDGDLTITGSTLSNNTAASDGGAINHYTGTVTITDSTITNNTSGNSGGGAWIGGGSLVLTNSDISYNTADYDGAGLYLYYGTAQISDSSITENTNYTLFTNNYGFSYYRGGEGAGIFNYGTTLSINNSDISHNTSAFEGGGISSANIQSDITITNSTISYNESLDSQGGGIYVGDGGSLTITDSSITHNTSGSMGGGIYIDEIYSTLTITRSDISYNEAGSDGGGIYSYGDLTIIDSTITNNYSATLGGGIYIEDGKATIINSQITDNYAVNRGGGLYNEEGTMYLQGTTVSGNRTGGQGGGIYNSDGFLTITDSTISENEAEDEGGGIYNDGGVITITDSIISNNSTEYSGGGIYNSYGSITITGSTISGNYAYYNGGGIYNDGGRLTITDSYITGNTARDENGGGIHSYEGAVTITNTEISGNNSGAYGGGIYNDGGNLTISNSTFNSNEAYEDGGAIYHTGDKLLKITDSTITNNTAADQAGGVYISTTLGAEITRTTIDGNSAAYGGAISHDGNLKITDSTISNNTASGYGGGIYSFGDSINITNSTISGNSASKYGGGIYVTGVNLTLTSTTITNNSAADGGGIYDEGGSTIVATNSIVAGNTATTNAEIFGTISGTNNFTSGDPLLGALQDNGGPTFTHAPLAGSPVIDAGGTTTLTTDQRGGVYTRVVGSAVDIGAVEGSPEIDVLNDASVSIADETGTFDFGTTSAGTALVKIFTVRNDGVTPLTLSTPTITGTGFSLASDFAATTLAAGQSITFSVELDSTTALSATGTISFVNDDPDENPYNFAISGTVIAPEIEVLDGTTNINDGDVTAVNLGSTVFGSPLTKTFTINNNGDDVLTLSSVTLPTGFSVVGTSPTSVAAGSSASLQVQLDATAGGNYTGTVSIDTNDPDEDPFDFAIAGTVNAAEIAVTNGGVDIADGSTTAIDFGSTVLGTPITKTFLISNTGTTNLTLSSLNLPSGFSVVGVLPNSIGAGGQASLQIQLDAAAVGTNSGTISFTSNDPDETTFDFSITGAVTLTPEAEIQVLDGTIDITDGATNAIDFGSTLVGTAITKTFTVNNLGSADLTLSNLILPTGFTLVGNLPASITAGSSANVQIQMDATAEGVKSGTMVLVNNDSNENPFDFAITGAVTVTPEPEVQVLFGGLDIVSGNTTALEFGNTVAGTAITKTFTVKNIGTADLNLTNLQLPSGFSLVGQIPSTIAGGSQANLTIQLDANAAGTPSGTLSFTTNDTTESNFNFVVSGNVTATTTPEIEVKDGTTDIVDGTTTAIDIGTATVGTPISKTFVINNTGTANLNLSNISLPNGFSLVGVLPNSIAAGGTANLQIQLNAAAVGTSSGTLTFTTNDSDENPFDFVISGTVNAATPTPTPTPIFIPGSNTPVPVPVPVSVDQSCLCDVLPTPNVGNITLVLNTTETAINGADTDDLLMGTAVNEAINGFGGNDTLVGKEGNDNLDAGTGNDVVFGNTGNDIIFGNAGIDILFGGQNNDLLAGDVDDDLLFGDIGNDSLAGGEGNDLLAGNIGADLIEGGNGNDLILGGKDDDALMGNTGEDTVLGNIGNDLINGAEGNDLLFGNSGFDFIDAGDGNDSIFGGKDDDILKGNTGNDMVLGDIGNDSICGGEGNDMLFGNVGADLIDGCEGDDSLYGGKEADTVKGNTGNDLISGDQGNDLLFGNSGADILIGGDGNDNLYGGKDNDALIGSIGDDLLDGDSGNDTLTGGAGADKFVLGQNYGAEIITDFSGTEDLLILGTSLSFQQLSLTSANGDTLIRVASTSELLATLQGVNVTQIGEQNFMMI